MARSTAAVHHIQKLCSDIRAVSAVPDDDKYGWDVFVQFPSPTFSGPAEDRPPKKVGYIQVKSTTGKGTSHKIKVSNLQEAVTSASPWFFLLVMPDDTVRGVHLWGDLLTEWMKLVRETAITGTPLHKAIFNLNFPKTTELDGNAAQWMLDQISSVGDHYESEKKKLIDSLGYEDGYGNGKFRFENMDRNRFIRMFLGLERDVAFDQFMFTEKRFGINEPTANVEPSLGKVTITPDPVGTCTIKVKSESGEAPLTLPGKVYAFRAPNAPIEQTALRFSSPPLEIVRLPDGGFDIKLMFDPDKRISLVAWLNYVRISHWAGLGQLDIKISRNGAQVIGAHARLDVKDDENIEILCAAIEGIQKIVSIAGIVAPELSEHDITSNFQDVFCFATSLNGSMQIEIQKDDAPTDCETVVYRTGIRFDHVHVSCFVTREVILNEVDGDIRRLRFGPPVIAEGDVIALTGPVEIDFLESGYGYFKETLAGSDKALDLGDINLLIVSGKTLGGAGEAH